jgi:hypothetical protein
MKKLLLLVAVVGAMSATSCKKDYTCTCTVSIGGYTSSASTTIHDTKKKATDACTANNTAGATCSIK